MERPSSTVVATAGSVASSAPNLALANRSFPASTPTEAAAVSGCDLPSRLRLRAEAKRDCLSASNSRSLRLTCFNMFLLILFSIKFACLWVVGDVCTGTFAGEGGVGTS